MLAPVTCEEVTKLIRTSRDSAPGYDEIKARPLQAVNSVTSAPLAHIFNLSIMNGVFPDILKTSNIIPLFKKEDSMLFSNYRPVSLLCTLSKLLEKNHLQQGYCLFKRTWHTIQISIWFSSKLLNLFGPNCISWQVSVVFRKWRLCCGGLSWFFKSVWYRWSRKVIS